MRMATGPGSSSGLPTVRTTCCLFGHPQRYFCRIPSTSRHLANCSSLRHLSGIPVAGIDTGVPYFCASFRLRSSNTLNQFDSGRCSRSMTQLLLRQNAMRTVASKPTSAAGPEHVPTSLESLVQVFPASSQAFLISLGVAQKPNPAAPVGDCLRAVDPSPSTGFTVPPSPGGDDESPSSSRQARFRETPLAPLPLAVAMVFSEQMNRLPRQLATHVSDELPQPVLESSSEIWTSLGRHPIEPADLLSSDGAH